MFSVHFNQKLLFLKVDSLVSLNGMLTETKMCVNQKIF